MAVLLSLFSALAYGISDYLGGIFAKRSSPWQVAVAGQSSSAVCASLAAILIGWNASSDDLLTGAIAGLGSGVGVVYLYRGLANARMGVVAPLSAVGAALIPVAFGLITGERPSWLAAAGIIVAFPAIAMISKIVDEDPTHRGGVIDGVVAGLGFGVMFMFLGRASEDSGLAPLAMSQITSVLTVVAFGIALRQVWIPDRTAMRAIMMGPLGSSAQGAFLYATHHGLLSVVSVISSLYPAGTVLLAAVLLRERIHRVQGIGLALAMLAVALVAAG